MKCKCGHRLLTRSGDKVKLRCPILVFSADGSSCVTQCPGCKQEVKLPVTLDPTAVPAAPKLVIAPR